MLKVNGIVMAMEPKHVPEIFTLFPDLHYWSKDALAKLFIEVLKIGIEMAKDRKGGGRFTNSARRQIITFKRYVGEQDAEWVIQQIYNEILRSEGLSTLHGFGFSNRYGDRILGNSEQQSILEPKTYQPTKEEQIMAVKRSQLIKAATELQKELGCKPPIDTKVSKEKEIDGVSYPFNTYLEKMIVTASTIIEPDDEISDETMAVIRELTESKTPAPGEKEEEGPEVETGDVDLTELLATTKKLADLKIMVGEYDIFKSLRKKLDDFAGLSGSRELRPFMEKCLGIKPKEKAAAKPEGAGAKKKGVYAERIKFLTPLIEKGKLTRKELLEKAAAQFPDATATALATVLSDGMNPKYNKFDRLLTVDANKVVSFK